METVDILKAARALIDTPEKWTRGLNARDAHGQDVRPNSLEAVCFCARGAIIRSAGFEHIDAYELLQNALPIGGNDFVPAYNDNPDTTHADIMALFDRAIELAEKQNVISQ